MIQETEKPYSEEEIKQSEYIIDECFPESLRNYLLNISRELFYESKYDIIKLPTSSIGTCTIPTNITVIAPKNPSKSYITPEGIDGFVPFISEGCGCYDYIVLKGNHKGSIWELTDYNLRLIYKSFDDIFLGKIYHLNPFDIDSSVTLYV